MRPSRTLLVQAALAVAASLIAAAAVSQPRPRRAEAAYGVDDAALVGAAGAATSTPT